MQCTPWSWCLQSYNNLRRQTQQRLDDELCLLPIFLSGRRLVPFTNSEQDYQSVAHSTLLTAQRAMQLVRDQEKRQPTQKLHEQLTELSEYERMAHRLLIVDDEADHATINTKKTNEPNPDLPDAYGDESLTGEDDEERDAEISDATKINSYIRMILGLFTHRAYVGYTATPFANVLIDPDSVHSSLGRTLYPRDFIIALPKPEEYIGLQEFFPTASS